MQFCTVNGGRIHLVLNDIEVSPDPLGLSARCTRFPENLFVFIKVPCKIYIFPGFCFFAAIAILVLQQPIQSFLLTEVNSASGAGLPKSIA
jgi:hypothetical protein